MKRVTALERVTRVLQMVPWIVAADGPTRAEIRAEFDLSEEELESDLETLTLVGRYPYSPDTLIEVDIWEDRVWIRWSDSMLRPQRWTPAQGVALLAAVEAVLPFESDTHDGALARAARKLRATLDTTVVESVKIVPENHDGDTVAQLRDAIENNLVVTITYVTKTRTTSRRIHPYAIAAIRGIWYVAAFCEQAQDHRRFRVSNIPDIEVGERSGLSILPEQRLSLDASSFEINEGLLVNLAVNNTGLWAFEDVPSSQISRDGTSITDVVFPVRDEQWFGALLLAVVPSLLAFRFDPPDTSALDQQAVEQIFTTTVNEIRALYEPVTVGSENE